MKIKKYVEYGVAEDLFSSVIEYVGKMVGLKIHSDSGETVVFEVLNQRKFYSMTDNGGEFLIRLINHDSVYINLPYDTSLMRNPSSFDIAIWIVSFIMGKSIDYSMRVDDLERELVAVIDNFKSNHKLYASDSYVVMHLLEYVFATASLDCNEEA